MWEPPFLSQNATTPRAVARVLRNTHPFMLGRACLSSCVEAATATAKSTVPSLVLTGEPRENLDETTTSVFNAGVEEGKNGGHETNVNDDDDFPENGDDDVRDRNGSSRIAVDFWGREEVIRPKRDAGHKTLMFVTNTWNLWERAVADDASNPPVSKKKRLDRLITHLYASHVLKRDGAVCDGSSASPARRLTRLFVDKMSAVLHAYCVNTGKTYGSDVLLLHTGGAVECFPAHVRDRIPDAVSPMNLFDIYARDTSPPALADLQQLVHHVVYAIEREMRETAAWKLQPPDLLSTASDAFREIEPTITAVRSATASSVSDSTSCREQHASSSRDRNASVEADATAESMHEENGIPGQDDGALARSRCQARKDSGIWPLRIVAAKASDTSDTSNACKEVQCVVIKPTDCLVWSNSRRDDESTVQGSRRLLRDATPEAALFVSTVWPATKVVVDDDEAEAGRRRVSHVEQDAGQNDTVVKLRYDVIVETASDQHVRCAADVLTARIRGTNDRWRLPMLDAASLGAWGGAYVVLDGVPVPTVYANWCAEMHAFFDWIENPRTYIDPDTARSKAHRLMWSSAALDMQVRTIYNYHGGGSGPFVAQAAATQLLDALQTLRFALSVPEGVVINSAHGFFFPLAQLLHACKCACEKDGRQAAHREWLRATLSAAITCVSARLCSEVLGFQSSGATYPPCPTATA